MLWLAGITTRQFWLAERRRNLRPDWLKIDSVDFDWLNTIATSYSKFRVIRIQWHLKNSDYAKIRITRGKKYCFLSIWPENSFGLRGVHWLGQSEQVVIGWLGLIVWQYNDCDWLTQFLMDESVVATHNEGWSGFTNSNCRQTNVKQWGVTTGHVVKPTCHYDVNDFVFVAKRRGLYDVIFVFDVIMTSFFFFNVIFLFYVIMTSFLFLKSFFFFTSLWRHFSFLRHYDVIFLFDVIIITSADLMFWIEVCVVENGWMFLPWGQELVPHRPGIGCLGFWDLSTKLGGLVLHCRRW